MISKAGFRFAKLRVGSCARFQGKGDILKCRVQAALCLPSKRAALSCLVFRKSTSYLVKFDTLVELSQRLLLLGVLLALQYRKLVDT